MDEPEDEPVFPSGAGDAGDAGRRRVALRKVAHVTAAVGAVFAVLFLASMWVLSRTPGPRATDQEILDFYGSGDDRRLVLVGLYLLPFSAVAFLWFMALLREWVSGTTRRSSRLLANVQFLAGVSFITLSFAAAAASTATAASVEFSDAPLDPSLARQFPLYGSALLYIFGMRMAAIFVTTTTNIGRAAGVFPRPFVLASYVVAAFLFLTATLSLWLVVVFPLWVVALCGLIYARARQIPADATVPAMGTPSPGLVRTRK